MSHLLALEWDAREARMVLARRRGKSAQIEQAFAIDLRPVATDAAAPTDATTPEARLGKRLGAILRQHGATRVEAVVAIGRSNIELRMLSVPQVPPEELPDLVRFQALKQFSSVGDSWPIDFVPLASPEQGPLNVLAASIAPELVDQIKSTCAAAEIQPRRLVLRPFAAASLWQQQQAVPGCVLMVDLLAEDGDLTVVVDGDVAFIRTIRLPTTEDADELARGVFGEIRRTIAAASNQLGGRRVERVVICGGAADYAPLRQLITQQSGLPCEHFDPFEGLDLSADLVATRPAHGGRFAPLLGMVVQEAAGTREGIDFLNPRRRPEPPNRRRQWALASVAALVATLAIAFLIWRSYRNLDQEIAELKAEGVDLDGQIKRIERPQRDAQEIDEFVAGNVVWLDEICELSVDFLSPDTAIVSKMSCLVSQNGGGTVTVEGHVRQSSDIDELESRLRDDRHRVNGTGARYDAKEGQYPWAFKETVVVPRVGYDETRDSKPPADGKPPTDGKSPTEGKAPTDGKAPPNTTAKTSRATEARR